MHRIFVVGMLLSALSATLHAQTLSADTQSSNNDGKKKEALNSDLLATKGKSLLVRLSKIEAKASELASVAKDLQAGTLKLAADNINIKAKQISDTVKTSMKRAGALKQEKQEKPHPGELENPSQSSQPAGEEISPVDPNFLQLKPPGLPVDTAVKKVAPASSTNEKSGDNKKQSLFEKLSQISASLKESTMEVTMLENTVTSLTHRLALRKDGTCDNAGVHPQHGNVGNCKNTMAKGKSCQPSCTSGATASGVRSCSSDGKSILTDTFTCKPNPCTKWAGTRVENVIDNAVDFGDCTNGIAHSESCHPTCKDTYTPKGEWACAYGKWDTKNFICDPPTCDGSHRLENGRNKKKIYTTKWEEVEMTPCSSEMEAGSVCKQEAGATNICIDGFEAQGKRECGQVGELNTDDLKCVEAPCDATTVTSKTIKDSGTCKKRQKSGTKCAPTCIDGYTPSRHNPTVTCNKGKIGGGFKCVGKPCSIDPDTKPKHADSRVRPNPSTAETCHPFKSAKVEHFGTSQSKLIFTATFMDHGDTCNWDCVDGYSPKVNSFDRCQLGKIVETFECVPDGCKKSNEWYKTSHAKNMWNGKQLCPAILPHGASCTPRCNKGYESNGKKRTCTLGKLADEFKCVPAKCKLSNDLFQSKKRPGGAAETNGGRGNCPKEGTRLAHAAKCEPKCQAGHKAYGELSCDKGVLTDTHKCVPQACKLPQVDNMVMSRTLRTTSDVNILFTVVNALPKEKANVFPTKGDSAWKWENGNAGGAKNLECVWPSNSWKKSLQEYPELEGRTVFRRECNSCGFHISLAGSTLFEAEMFLLPGRRYVPCCAKGYESNGGEFQCGAGSLTRSDFKCIPKQCTIPEGVFKPYGSTYEDDKSFKPSSGRGKGPFGEDLPNYAFPSDIAVVASGSNDCTVNRDGSITIKHGGKCKLSCSGQYERLSYRKNKLVPSSWYTMMTGIKNNPDVLACSLGELNVPALRNPLCEFYRNSNRNLVLSNNIDHKAAWALCQTAYAKRRYSNSRYSKWYVDQGWGTSIHSLGKYLECVPKSCTLTNKQLVEYTYYAIPLEEGKDVTIAFGSSYVPDCPIGFEPVGAITCGKTDISVVGMPDLSRFYCKPMACFSWVDSKKHSEEDSSPMHGEGPGTCHAPPKGQTEWPSQLPTYFNKERPKSRDIYKKAWSPFWTFDEKSKKWIDKGRFGYTLAAGEYKSSTSKYRLKAHQLGSFDTWSDGVQDLGKSLNDPYYRRLNGEGSTWVYDFLALGKDTDNKKSTCVPECNENNQPFTYFDRWQTYSGSNVFTDKKKGGKNHGPPLECRLGQFVVPNDVVDPKNTAVDYPRTSAFPQPWLEIFGVVNDKNVGGRYDRASYCLPKPCVATSKPLFGTIGDCKDELLSGEACTPTCEEGYEPDPDGINVGFFKQRNPEKKEWCVGSSKKALECAIFDVNRYTKQARKDLPTKIWRGCKYGSLKNSFRCVPKGCPNANTIPKYLDIPCKDLVLDRKSIFWKKPRNHPCKKQTPTLMLGGAGNCPAKLAHGDSCVPTCGPRFRINKEDGGKRTCLLGKLTDTAKCLPLFDAQMCPANRMTSAEKAAHEKELLEKEKEIRDKETKAEESNKKQEAEQLQQAYQRTQDGKNLLMADNAFVNLELTLKADLFSYITLSIPKPGERLSDTVLNYIKFGKQVRSFQWADAKARKLFFGKRDVGQVKLLNKFCIPGFCPPTIGKQAEDLLGVGGDCKCQGKNLMYPKNLCRDEPIQGFCQAQDVAGPKQACKWTPKSSLKQAVSKDCKHVDEASRKFTEEYDKIIDLIDCAYDLITDVNSVAKMAMDLENKTNHARDLFKKVRTGVNKLKKTVPLQYIKTLLEQLDNTVLEVLESTSESTHNKIKTFNTKLRVEKIKTNTDKWKVRLTQFMTGLVNFKSALINGYWVSHFVVWYRLLLVVACCCLLLLVVACCCLLLLVVACCCLLSFRFALFDHSFRVLFTPCFFFFCAGDNIGYRTVIGSVFATTRKSSIHVW
jgi:hypothetical protein